MLFNYVEGGLWHDWLDYPVNGNLHLDCVSEILSNRDAPQILLQLEKPDAVAALLRWTFLSVQWIESLPSDALRGRELLVEDLAVDHWHKPRDQFKVLIELCIFRERERCLVLGC